MEKIFRASINFLFFVLIALFLVSQQAEAKSKTVKIKCTEMSCIGCKKKITESINTLDGITKVKVNLDTKIITVTYDDSKTDANKIIGAITDAGYESELIE